MRSKGRKRKGSEGGRKKGRKERGRKGEKREKERRENLKTLSTLHPDLFTSYAAHIQSRSNCGKNDATSDV